MTIDSTLRALIRLRRIQAISESEFRSRFCERVNESNVSSALQLMTEGERDELVEWAKTMGSRPYIVSNSMSLLELEESSKVTGVACALIAKAAREQVEELHFLDRRKEIDRG